MTDKSNIAIALAKAQMSMGKALKQSTNPHFRSKYADLGNVMDACMEDLNENGIAVIQPVRVDDGGSRFVDTIFIHGESGETLECTVPIITQKNDMQGFGSAVTYARRYGLQTMAGIAPEDDDGNAAQKAAPKKHDGDAAQGLRNAAAGAVSQINNAETLDSLRTLFGGLHKDVKAHPDVIKAKDERKAALEKQDQEGDGPIDDDQIPY